MSNNMEKMITMIIVIIIALLIGGIAFGFFRNGKATAIQHKMKFQILTRRYLRANTQTMKDVPY